VDLDGEKPYADNFFDVLPGIPLSWIAKRTGRTQSAVRRQSLVRH